MVLEYGQADGWFDAYEKKEKKTLCERAINEAESICFCILREIATKIDIKWSK